jgi:FKBP-type peptidyl-prolyl cis-trans isomerase FklB
MSKNNRMNKLGLIFLAVLGFFSSCVSDSENDQVIFQRNLEQIEKYISENDIPSVKEFNDPATGIRIYWQETSASGNSPAIGDSLRVDYVGKLLNNFVFDTSVDSVARANNMFNPNRTYGPFKMVFGVTSLIVGFDFALSKMEEGDIATVIFPSIYGYGSRDQNDIPANSPLVFQINLVQVQIKDE